MKQEGKHFETAYKSICMALAANLFISAFTFGGGYIVVPMVRRLFVVKKQYFATVYKGIHIKKQNNGLPTY